MAVAGIRVSLGSDQFASFARELSKMFPPEKAASVLGGIIAEAIKPMTQKLRQITPLGPTGNLRRAVASKVVQYGIEGVAVGLVGFTRAGRDNLGPAAGGSVKAGKDRAFHQWWLETGTDRRSVAKFANKPYQRRSPTKPFTRVRLGRQETVSGKGVVHWVSGQNAYIASSYNKLGPFRLSLGRGGGVETDPQYPRAFFKKSSQPISLPATPAGGTSGQPPLNTAFMQTQSQMAAVLQKQLSLSLSEAWASLKFKDSGVINSTSTL
jgi:hypothetical protein